MNKKKEKKDKKSIKIAEKIIKINGRPKKYKTPEQMQEVLEEYFNRCAKKKIPFTITGICIALGLTRESLRLYEKNEDFFDTIRQAKLLVENYLELSLYEKNNSGVRFNLSANFGWKEMQQVEHSGCIGSYEATLKDVCDDDEY